MLGPPGSARITAATRHNVTSVLVYAAKPPHTSATFLSVLERYNFFIAQNKMEDFYVQARTYFTDES